MKTGFYPKMALGNLRKNYRFFLPRMLTEIGLLGSFYIFLTLSLDSRMASVKGGAYIPSLMGIGVAVMGILSVILMLYTNSFLMKQRKREFGLYNVLGMEKRHVCRVLFWESFFSSLPSIFLGLGFGILFYKISSLIICKLLMTEVVIGFYFITPKTILPAGLAFLFLDLFTYLVNCITIGRMKPVEMLKSFHTGEKEPKIQWPLLVIGVLALCGGYGLSIFTENPLAALGLFFVAVLLVVIGTYCLFVAGTIFVLKLLKKNQGYYYQKRHMPAVSGLLYRMKQNAMGLASICILSTGILVMLSTTIALYSGMEKTLENRFPHQYYNGVEFVTCTENEETREVHTVPFEVLKEAVEKGAAEAGLSLEETVFQEYLEVGFLWENGNLLYDQSAMHLLDTTRDLCNFIFITQEEYYALTGEWMDLQPKEIVLCPFSMDADTRMDHMTLDDMTLTIVKKISAFPIRVVLESMVKTYGVILPDKATLDTIFACQEEAYGLNASAITTRVGVRFSDDIAKLTEKGPVFEEAVWNYVFAYAKSFEGFIGELTSYPDSLWEVRDYMFSMYGTFLFLGCLLGLVFMFATVLIIYYKQISEGYEDRDRFQIMEKIGMSSDEVKRTIRTQVLLVFFLPLVAAGVHMGFALPILGRMLSVFQMTDNTGLICCSAIVFAVFALFYWLIYSGTSKTYYQIVR